MKNLHILLGLALLFILVATNPSREKHRARVFDAAAEQAAREMGDGIGRAFGELIGAHKVPGAVAADKLEYVNLFVGSFGRIDGKLATVGALNCVAIVK